MRAVAACWTIRKTCDGSRCPPRLREEITGASSSAPARNTTRSFQIGLGRTTACVFPPLPKSVICPESPLTWTCSADLRNPAARSVEQSQEHPVPAFGRKCDNLVNLALGRMRRSSLKRCEARDYPSAFNSAAVKGRFRFCPLCFLPSCPSTGFSGSTVQIGQNRSPADFDFSLALAFRKGCTFEAGTGTHSGSLV